MRKKISFKQLFIEDLDLPDNYFDTISACETLEHIAPGQLINAMNNLTRMLKKDGNMIVTVPNRYPADIYIKQKRDRWKWPTHYRYFNMDILKFFLNEYFEELQFYSLYENEKPSRSIYLICNCKKKYEKI